jgi:hypothetical protein
VAKLSVVAFDSEKDHLPVVALVWLALVAAGNAIAQKLPAVIGFPGCRLKTSLH